MPAAALTTGALLLGYLAGRVRPWRRLFDAAYEFATADSRPRSLRRCAAETVCALLAVPMFLMHPGPTVTAFQNHLFARAAARRAQPRTGAGRD